MHRIRFSWLLIHVLFPLTLLIICSTVSGEQPNPGGDLQSIFIKAVPWYTSPDEAEEYRDKLVAMGPAVLPGLLPLMENEYLLQQYTLQDIIYGMIKRGEKPEPVDDGMPTRAEINAVLAHCKKKREEHCRKRKLTA